MEDFKNISFDYYYYESKFHHDCLRESFLREYFYDCIRKEDVRIKRMLKMSRFVMLREGIQSIRIFSSYFFCFVNSAIIKK